jgi:endo-1,4-beta-xylanase
MRYLFVSFILFAFFSFIPKDEPICDEAKLYSICPFPVGAAVNTEKLQHEEKYYMLAFKHFNSITAERIMKPAYMHPKRNTYNFHETDLLIDYCRQNNKRLHGHTLVWHSSLPQWMEKFKGDKNEWETMLKEHIQTIIKHCSPYVKSWDVVNEAFNDDGSLRNNIWLKNIGEDYIEKAFRYAAEADSTVLLFYNDYSLEKYDTKFLAVVSFLKNLKAKGVKIDGVGMQMHVNLNFPYISDINQAAIHLQEEGFIVHYSEMDVSLTGHSIFASKSKLLELQKQRVRSIVEGYMKLNPKNRFGITFWGVSDNDSWLTEKRPRSRPLLFDADYKLKPAYCGFIEALK